MITLNKENGLLIAVNERNEKICYTCKQVKPQNEFIISFPDGRLGSSSYCDACTLARKDKYRENKRKYAPKSRQRRQLLKANIINVYGGKCACCGEKEPQFLALDHINK